MTIKQGDFVRAINPKLGLPPGSVWHTRCAKGGLKLEPVNESAKRGSTWAWHCVLFSPQDFEKVASTCDGWVPAQLESNWIPANDFAVRNFLEKSTIMQELSDQPTNRAPGTVVKDYQHLLQNARDLESSRRQALRRAKAAQAKADKEAAAKAKVVEAERQLAARLHAALWLMPR